MSNLFKQPEWIDKINRQLIQLRADIYFLLETSKRKANQPHKIRIIVKYDLYKKTEDTRIEILKQKLQLKT